MATKVARELVVGDVVHYTAKTSWRIDSVEALGASIVARFTYVSCDFEPGRIGTQAYHPFRATTQLKVS